MTIVEFIKSQLSMGSTFAELAKGIQGDKNFPADKSEKQIIAYLSAVTYRDGNKDLFDKFLSNYLQQKHTENDTFDLNAKFSILRAENWRFYKEYFPVHKVILVGKKTDIYKVYCIDSERRIALYFHLKSKESLNDIALWNVDKIYRSNLSIEVSVQEAIQRLKSCPYETPAKPDAPKFKELIEYLQANK